MLTKERLEQIKYDGKLLGGNIGPTMFKEVIAEIERLRPDLLPELSTKDLIGRINEAHERAHENPIHVGPSFHSNLL